MVATDSEEISMVSKRLQSDFSGCTEHTAGGKNYDADVSIALVDATGPLKFHNSLTCGGA